MNTKKEKIIFITGGARSGKSTLALKLAKKISKDKVTFIATCTPKDREMSERVQKHKKERPKSWKTIEEPDDLYKALTSKTSVESKVVIVDCLTILISNLLLSGKKEDSIINEIGKALKKAKGYSFTLIVVSNEVGSGIVSVNEIARHFRDIAGKANQLTANISNSVYAMISGIPVKIK